MLEQDHFRKRSLQIAQDLNRDIQQKWPDLALNFVVFRRGQFRDESERSLAGLKMHPCHRSAHDLLHNKSNAPEISSFLGIASGTKKSLLGLRRKHFYISFISLNIDQYASEQEFLFDLYHLTAQTLDMFQAIHKHKSGSAGDIVLQPKRNQLAMSRSNLRSDIFSALIMTTTGHKKAVMDLARYRAEKTLTPQSFYRPEDYPFVISTDVMSYSIKTSLAGEKAKDAISLFALSNRIAASFDKHNLRSWINFSGPSQTMAWNGYTREQILGSAINSSTDPFIKSTANLVCEITQIVPEERKFPPNASNAFVDDRINAINHARLAEETFELAMVHALEAESHLPLIQIANDQNNELLKGRMLGWCANALQSTASTFEQMLKKGLPPAPASRIEFQRLASQLEWENLESLNTHNVTQRRNGHAMTFTDIAQYCSTRPELRTITDSIEITINDPTYKAQLAMANEAPAPLARPVITPTMQMQAAPAMQHAPAATPGMMGGGMMGGGMSSPPIVTRPVVPPPAKFETEDEE